MNNNTLFYQDKCARITPKSNGGEQGTTPNHSEQGLALILEKKKKTYDEALFKNLLCRRCGLQHVLLVGNGQAMSYYIFLQQESQVIALLDMFQNCDWCRNIGSVQTCALHFTGLGNSSRLLVLT